MSEPNVTSTRRARVWAVSLLLSLALNLFLGGVLLGRSFRPERPPSPMGPLALLRAPQELDPAARDVVDRTREKHDKEIRRAMRHASKAREEAVDALCVEDFNESEARRAFRLFRAEMEVAHEAMNESLIETAKQMNGAQRSVLREELVRSARPAGRWGKGRGPGVVPHGAFPEPPHPPPVHSVVPVD